MALQQKSCINSEKPYELSDDDDDGVFSQSRSEGGRAPDSLVAISDSVVNISRILFYAAYVRSRAWGLIAIQSAGRAKRGKPTLTFEPQIEIVVCQCGSLGLSRNLPGTFHEPSGT